MKQRFYFDGDRDRKRSFQSMKNLMALCGALCALSLAPGRPSTLGDQ